LVEKRKYGLRFSTNVMAGVVAQAPAHPAPARSSPPLPQQVFTRHRRPAPLPSPPPPELTVSARL